MIQRQSNNKRNGGIATQPSLSQKFPSAKNPLENFRINFLGANGILPIEYLPKGQTVSAEY